VSRAIKLAVASGDADIIRADEPKKQFLSLGGGYYENPSL